MRGLLQNRFIQVIAAIAAAVAGLVGALALTPPANTAPPTTPAPAHPHHITRPKKHSAPSPDFPAPTTESPSSTVAAPAAPAATAPPPGLVVHVAGEVLHPNVYTLPASARIIDAVRAAGGVRRDADLDAVNLAAHIQDGEQIFVPTHALVTAVEQHPRSPIPAPAGRAPFAGPLATIVHSTAGRGGHASSIHSDKLTDPSQGTVDLNSATADQLVRLPGVGPSTAAKILDFRKQNGRFTALEDVMNVKGIGPAKFARMKPFLTLR